MSLRCRCCRRRFDPQPHIKNQHYCSRSGCQAARRRLWRRRKLATDEDYRDDQREAQRRWLDKHPDYFRRYRATHPNYTERNRIQQRQRNLRLRHDGEKDAETCSGMIAKSDAYRAENSLVSGLYSLFVVPEPMIAKSDTFLVKLRAIPNG